MKTVDTSIERKILRVCASCAYAARCLLERDKNEFIKAHLRYCTECRNWQMIFHNPTANEYVCGRALPACVKYGHTIAQRNMARSRQLYPCRWCTDQDPPVDGEMKFLEMLELVGFP